MLLTEIYAAGEDPLPGVSLAALAEEVRRSVRGPVDVVPELEDLPGAIARIARRGDVVITLGAGSIGTVPDQLIGLIERRPHEAPATGAST